MTGAPTRVALHGFGRWGRNILRDLLDLNCQVDVFDPNAQARASALEAGAARAARPGEIDSDVDGHVIATPSSTHAALIEALLEAGTPLFVEKPMTTSVREAERLVEAGAGRLFVMHKWTYHPGVEALADLAASEDFGPLETLHLRRLQWGQPHADADAAWILAVHDLSIVRAVLGRIPPILAVAGATAGGAVEGATAILGGDTGPRVVIDASSIWPRSERLIAATFRDAVVALPDSLADHLAVYRRTQKVTKARDVEPDERRPISTEMPLKRELAAFVDHLRGGPPPKTDAAEGLDVVRAVAALRAAAGVD